MSRKVGFCCTLLALSAAGRLVAAPRPVAVSVAVERGEDFASERAKLHSKFADGLYEVGKWCHKKKWYQERDRLWNAALEVAPDHLRVRKALGFERRRDGSWERRKEREPQRNRGRVDFDAIEARTAEVLAQWREATYALLDKYGEQVSDEDRRAEYALVLARFPDDERAHKALGHVPGWAGHPWVSPAARASHDRREALEKLIARARKVDASPEPVELRDYEQGLAWEASGKSEKARVFSREGAKEVREALGIARAVESLMQEGLEVEVELPEGLTCYLVGSNEDLIEVAKAHPAEDGPGLEEVGSLWLDWHTLVIWGEDRELRLEGVSRQLVSWCLRRRYQLGTEQGWAWEGIGLYLSFRICGTRRRFYSGDNDYTRSGGREDLHDPRVNWLKEAKTILGNSPPKLAYVLGKSVDQLSERELLIAYALGAYLVEVHPSELLKALPRLPSEPATQVLEETLGLNPDALTKALTAWLGELY